MTLPPLTYLTFDSLTEGVGASQVLAYVAELARRGLDVSLHSFEKDEPSDELRVRVRRLGVRWLPHPFGPFGPVGGLSRVVRGARALHGSELVHARSDLPAASALLARCDAWVWDIRGFWADERIELGQIRPGSLEERVMRRVERGAARSAGGIITVAENAIPVLEERHGPVVAAKARVVATCVDLVRFAPSEMPPAVPLRLLLSGTLNARYDVDAMVRFVRKLSERTDVRLDVLCPDPAQWEGVLRSVGAVVGHASSAEMPSKVRDAHAGLSVLRAGSTVASQASMPTKLGEFLASGRPVVVSRNLGDTEALLTRFDCGVILAGTSEEELARGAEELLRLVSDAGVANRCRALAEQHFSLESGVDSLLETYAAAANRAAK